MPDFSCSAILFDLDGVLVDSTRSVGRQWRIWAQEHSIDPDKVVEVAHGVRSIEVIRMLAPHLDAEQETRKLETREAADIEGVTVMHGAAGLLRSIPQDRWCVVTSGTRYLATARLKLANLPLPRVLVTADEVIRGKPDPEPYLAGARLLHFNAENCLVIEDAPAGIRAAHAAKMKAIALTSTYSAQNLAEADAIINSLAQLTVTQDKDSRLSVHVDSGM